MGLLATETKIPPEPEEPPGTPGNLMATPGDHQVTLSWKDIPALGLRLSLTTNTNTGRQCVPFDENTNTWIKVPGGGSSLQVTVSGLAEATSYAFRVRAVNAKGAGSPSTEVEATPYDGSTPEPEAPPGLGTTSGDRQVTLELGGSAFRGLSESFVTNTNTGRQVAHSMTHGLKFLAVKVPAKSLFPAWPKPPATLSVCEP